MCVSVWRIFGPKREVVTEDDRKLHNERLRSSYPIPDISTITAIKIKSKRLAIYIGLKEKIKMQTRTKF